MEENPNPPDMFQESPAPEQVAGWQPAAPKARIVLLVLFAACTFFAGISTIVCQLIVQMGGWSETLMTGMLRADATEMERWQMRFLLGFRHFSVFFLAGFFTVWLFYRGITRPVPGWADYLRSRQWPSWRTAGLAMLLLLVSVPLVLFLFQLNKMLPLPEAFHTMEAQANEAIKSLLRMNHFGHLTKRRARRRHDGAF